MSILRINIVKSRSIFLKSLSLRFETTHQKWYLFTAEAQSKNPVIYHRRERRDHRVLRLFQSLLRFSDTDLHGLIQV